GRETAPPAPSLVTPPAVVERNPQDCVERFDASRDYFPDKVAPRFASGFRVAYHRHYKVVSLGRAWGGEVFRYLLVQCGTPVPAGFDDVPVIPVPAPSVITTSTTELPAIVALDLVDRLLAHSTFDFVSSPEVRARIAAGAMFEAGKGGELDVERVIAAAPGVLLADSLGHPELDPGGLHRRLRAAGVRVAIVPSFLEATPLGRAEWLKYVALFFNREAHAEAAFDAVAGRYRELARRGRAAAPRPSAITGGPAGDVWHVPGGRSFMATLLADAGFDYLWAGEPSSGSLPLSFEAVYARALDADWWIHPSGWRSPAEIAAADPRLARLASFRRGDVVTHDRRLNAAGGNDYWESGNARPDLVLADLLHLAHPELLPGHRLVYHRRLGGGDD
ncbi:MAG: ABC transporter substrate-binding protein, partial [Acidobacteria bacterium]